MKEQSIRGQMSAKAAVSLVVVIFVFGIIAAFGLPIAMDQLNSDTSVTIQQDVGATEEVNAELNSTLDSVDGTADTATYTLNTSDQSITNTIDNGTNATYSFDRGDVVVTVNDVNTGSPGNASATYEHNRDFSYSDGASALWGVLGLAIILSAFLYVISIGLRATNRL